MVYAPLMIMVYDRLEHLKQLIDSLLLDPLSSNTDLYLISDAAYKDEHKTRIEEVRTYAHSIKGFKTVNIIANIDNMGAFDSYEYLKNLIFEKHDNLIFFEDDNIVSPNYLEFMNNAFHSYKDNPKVAYVCGYNFPIDISKEYPYDVYFYPSVCAWGYGLWKSKTLDVSKLTKEEMRKDKKTLDYIKKNSSQLYHILMSDIYSGRFLNDARIGYLLCKNEMVSVFPKYSLVKNIGHDGTGLHCGINDFYQKQIKHDDFIPTKFPENIFIDQNIQDLMTRYTNSSFKNTIKSNLKLAYLKFNYLIKIN